MARLTVVVPSFNSAEYLRQTISSLLCQRYRDLEIIVVDDASTDGTKELMESGDFPEVHYMTLEKNHGGPSRPRNEGFRKGKGEFFTFLDADDFLLPEHLADAVEFLDACPEAGLVFCRALRWGSTGEVWLHPERRTYPKFSRLPKMPVNNRGFLLDSQSTLACLFRENFLLPSGAVIRRQVLETVGLFDESLTSGDDRDMWFRVAREFPLGFIDRPGFIYREHNGSISSRGGRLLENRIGVLRKQLGLDLPPRARKNARRLLAENYSSLGFHYRKAGDYARSFDCCVKSLRESPSYWAIRGLTLAWLGDWLRKRTIETVGR